ncbi:MAG: SDR family NAD(P)-dependent oxidoreductase, partial [Pseudomonadota bacterium]|nr:SDR family NAD(P)-dependent oxidoreductase [Pseudomonadota bacterium]
MDLGLTGKVAMVTGASRGLGRYIALQLAEEGCDLAICARSAATLGDTAEEIRALGRRVEARALDVTVKGAAEEMVDATIESLGQVDILVNNVGGNRRGQVHETSDADWEEIMDLNFNSHLRFSRAVVPQMLAREEGVILFISSIFGREAGGKGLAIYNTTKTALISLAKIMSLELAGQGIRVNSIAPGSIRFPGGSWDKRCVEDPQGMAEFIRQNLPLGRFGSAEELADVVTFLASPRASLVTGSCFNVDGGQSHSLI